MENYNIDEIDIDEIEIPSLTTVLVPNNTVHKADRVLRKLLKPETSEFNLYPDRLSYLEKQKKTYNPKFKRQTRIYTVFIHPLDEYKIDTNYFNNIFIYHDFRRINSMFDLPIFDIDIIKKMTKEYFFKHYFLKEYDRFDPKKHIKDSYIRNILFPDVGESENYFKRYLYFININIDIFLYEYNKFNVTLNHEEELQEFEKYRKHILNDFTLETLYKNIRTDRELFIEQSILFYLNMKFLAKELNKNDNYNNTKDNPNLYYFYLPENDPFLNELNKKERINNENIQNQNKKKYILKSKAKLNNNKNTQDKIKKDLRNISKEIITLMKIKKEIYHMRRHRNFIQQGIKTFTLYIKINQIFINLYNKMLTTLVFLFPEETTTLDIDWTKKRSEIKKEEKIKETKQHNSPDKGAEYYSPLAGGFKNKIDEIKKQINLLIKNKSLKNINKNLKLINKFK